MNLESLYREEWRRVLATTVRLTGDFDLSEEAVQDAFVAALEQWPRDGAPASPLHGWFPRPAIDWWISFADGHVFGKQAWNSSRLPRSKDPRSTFPRQPCWTTN